MGKYRTEMAVNPITKRRLWLVLDEETLLPMQEARAFAVYLSVGKAENTARGYMARVTGFLNWADAEPACDWKNVTLGEMARFKWSLERRPSDTNRPRSAKTVNLWLTAVVEFLRFCARSEFIPSQVADRLVEPRFVLTPTANAGGREGSERRLVRSPLLKSRERSAPPRTLNAAQIRAVIEASTSARDKFLIVLLATAGLRIGEALGLRRSDLHLLPDSSVLGCEIEGAHVHVVRRPENENRAVAKSWLERHVPVDRGVSEAYREYQLERDSLPIVDISDYVFVNLWGGAPGTPLTYSRVAKMFSRLRQETGVEVTPHMFRHTAATAWLSEGRAGIETVASLLGHASISSTLVYLHSSNAAKRAAVEKGANSLRRDS